MSDPYRWIRIEDAHVNRMTSEIALAYEVPFSKVESACKKLASQYRLTMRTILVFLKLGQPELRIAFEMALDGLIGDEEKAWYRHMLANARNINKGSLIRGWDY